MALPGTVPSDLTPDDTPPPARPRHRPLWLAVAALAAVGLTLLVHQVHHALSARHYTFLSTQGDYPVTWNHCKAIPYQVNPRGAPPGWEQVVHDAVADVEEHSGFVFADRGTSARSHLIGQRYDGNEWEPVLIVWTDRYQDAMIDGNTVGLGGSGAVDVDGVPRYVVGQVRLDTDVTDPTVTRLVLEHELGHVLGLGHSDDPDQLMYSSYHGQTGLGAGDVAGLQRLHDVPCSY